MDERIHVYNCDKVDYMDDQYFLIHATEDSPQTEAERYSLLHYKDFYNKWQLANDDGLKNIYATALKAYEQTEEMQCLIKREREKMRQLLNEKYPPVRQRSNSNQVKHEKQEAKDIPTKNENINHNPKRDKIKKLIWWIIVGVIILAVVVFTLHINKGDILAILRKVGKGSIFRGILFLPLFATGAFDIIRGLTLLIDSSDDDGKFSRMSDWKQTLFVGFHAVSVVIFFIILI